MTELVSAQKFNRIHNRKSFEVSSILTAYLFDDLVDYSPYWEEYDFSQIFLVLEGSGAYSTEAGTFPLSPGMMFYRPAFHRSCYQWNRDKVRFALISFVCESKYMDYFGLQPIRLPDEEAATLLDVIRTTVRICEPLKESDAHLGMRVRDDVPDVALSFIYASLERFLAMVYCRICNIDLLTDESQKVNRYLNDSMLVSQLKTYLSENISRSLTIAEISADFGISQNVLMRKFHCETGTSIISYFTDMKIALAKKQISETTNSFSAISDNLGFSSVHYFSKVFKSRTGLSPTEYSRLISKRRTAAQQIGKG